MAPRPSRRRWWSAGLLAVLGGCTGSGPADGDRDLDPGPQAPEEVPTYGYRVAGVFPHDPQAYTQGLAFADGQLYESTGLEGRSTLRLVELETGRVLRSAALERPHFGEGIALVGDRIYQLTWRSQVAFLYGRADFARIGQFTYPTQGWGLTHDGAALIMSDGSSTLYRRDPATFAEVGRVQVRHRGQPVSQLNELEWVAGEVWANLWQTDRVARIHPSTGQVVAWVALDGLLTPAERRQADVLNGIAYDPQGKRLFVTGKLWPWLFQVELVGPG